MESIQALEKFLLPLLSNKITQLVLGAFIAWLAVYMIHKFIQNFFKRTEFLDEKKEQTLESMLHSFLKYTATLGYVFFAFSVFNVEFGKMLAGAGIIGVVVGFGAQNLIKDVLSGIFLLYDKQLQKGDFVALNGKYNGTVEEIGIRVLKVREWSGKVLTISNGEVKEIQNYNIDRMRVIEKVTVSYYENPNNIYNTLQKACDHLNEQYEHCLKKDDDQCVVEPFQIFGITSLQSSFRGYEYTVVGLVDESFYWEASKQTRKAIAQAMYDDHIQMAEENLLLKQYSEKNRNVTDPSS